MTGVVRRRLTAVLVAALCLAGTAVMASPGARQPTVPTTFGVYPIPSEVRGAQSAGEPSIGVDWQTDEILYQSGGNTLRFTPSTGEWADATPPMYYTSFNLDPILVTDPTTGLTLAGGDDGSCSILAVTKDDGKTWQPSLPCTFTSDHPTVGIGPVVGTSPQAGERVVYFCEQYPIAEECTTSRDEGLTWLPAVPVTGGCMGLFGHVKVGPDGTAYLPVRECLDAGHLVYGVGGAVSTNNGRQWKSYQIPSIFPGRGFDPSVAITPDRRVYETWSAYPDFKPVVVTSRNRGKTWSKPVDVSKGAPYPIYAATFQAAVAGDTGRVAIAYLGADRPGTGTVTPFDNGYVGAWYLYVSATYDGGKHWTTTRVQDTPVQLGPLCDGGTRCLSGRNLLDFMDAGVTRDGHVVVGYAEGCEGGCPADVSQVAKSTNAWGVIAVQTSGPSLFR